LSPRSAKDHYNLGSALGVLQDWRGAAAANREALRLDPNFAEAHCNLGGNLKQLGLFAEALAAYDRGHRLGSARPDWRYPSDVWVKQARRLVELDAKLPRILDESEKPGGIQVQLEYAAACRLKGQYRVSARLYAGALEAEPGLTKSPAAGHRFQAACVAALAGTGADSSDVAAEEQGRWRKQALEWLRADLALWAARLDNSPRSRTSVRNALQSWRSEKTLAGIREPEALSRLPESERSGYIRFWSEVQELLVR